MVLNPDWKATVVDVIRSNDRLMLVKVVKDEGMISVISAYAPQSGCTQDEKDTFVEDMEALIRSIPDTERVVIGADMNSHVGTMDDTYVEVHGGHGYGRQNEDGSRFLEMAQGLGVIIVNTFFKKKSEHLITYRNGPYSSQIDYFMTRQMDRKYIQDCKVMPGEPVAKQHRLLVMVMNISFKKKDQRSQQKPRIRTWKLKGEYLKTFIQEVKEKFAGEQERSWENLKTNILESTRKICGVTKGQKRKERDTWW